MSLIRAMPEPGGPRPRACVGGGLVQLCGGRAAQAPPGARARMPSESRANGSGLVQPGLIKAMIVRG